MAKRLIIVLLLMAGLIGGLGFIKYRQVESAIAAGASFSIPATSVTTVVAKRETWPSTLSVIGTAAAIEGVTVGADLPGTVDKIHFESGQMVHEGDILVELDIRQERAQLANIEAQRDLAKVQYGRAEELSKAGVISKSEYDNAASQQKATEAQVNEVKASIARKTIHAPFTGVLGLRQISLGQYLAAGQAIVSLQSVNPIYVNFGVPQQDTPKMKIGRSVRVTSTDLPGVGFPGKITALDPGHAGKSRREAAPRPVPGSRVDAGPAAQRHSPAGVGHQLRAFWRFRLRCRRHKGREDRQNL